MSTRPSGWRGAAAGAAVAVGMLVVVGCSGGDDVAVRTDADRASRDLDLRTDASTTTRPDAPPATAAGEAPPGDGDSTGPARPGGVVVAPVAVAPAGASLGEALLREGPVDWVAVAETEPDLGPLTPAEAAASLRDPDAELSLLTTRRLRVAYARRWTAPSGTTATVVGYAFADAEGALAYEVDSYLALIGGGATEVVGLDRARGFTATSAGVTVHGRSLRVAERLFVVIVRGGPADAAVADALLEAQRVRVGVR